jgi:tryptophan 6-halogenase
MSGDNRVQSIVIVGGGTAGWLSAAYLNRALGKKVKITVIESKTIGRIGVGEATVSSWRITMQYLGFTDEDWMHRAGATYKTAIKFINWNREPIAGKPDEYFYHPFFDWVEDLPKPFSSPYFRGRGEGVSITHYWLKRFQEGQTKEHFARVAFPTPTLCDLKRSPRMKDSTSYEYNTAYHMDAQLVADFLRDVVIERGAEVLYDDVETATQDERGYLRSVKTKGGKEVLGDLFVDCTGFRGLLINQVLKVPFISENSSLLCNAAVAMPRKTDPEKDGINPFTIARTGTSGWKWVIPLFHRDGCGYVYSNNFQSKDSAEKELREYLGPGADDSPANHIQMRVGRNERLWEKNVVAVGLSGCFIEPLESTTIFLIEYALANLSRQGVQPDPRAQVQSRDDGHVQRDSRFHHSSLLPRESKREPVLERGQTRDAGPRLAQGEAGVLRGEPAAPRRVHQSSVPRAQLHLHPLGHEPAAAQDAAAVRLHWDQRGRREDRVNRAAHGAPGGAAAEPL